MADFTEQQKHAIRWLEQDACVVAGPGSGKTTVLVERYRELIEEHEFRASEILAITFTEKAAANMKRKLAEQFSHNQILQRDIESAWVSTIHGFCARLLRENAIAAGLDPRFTVLDAREAEEAQFDSMNRALDEITAHRRSETLTLIEALQTPHIANGLLDAYDAMRSAGRTIAEVRAMPAPIAPVEPAAVALRLLELLSTWPATLSDARRLHRLDLIEWAQRLGKSSASTLEEFLALAKSPLHLGKIPPSEKEVLTAFRESLEDMVASFVDRHAAGHRALLFDVLTRFEELYSERKTEQGALDFNDLERHSIQLLSTRPEVQKRVRSQFRQVMLDEFQDINEQQSRLIDLVRGDDVFFAVGDPNQSIYAFRHARPEIFHKYREDIAAANKHSAALLHNFRSRDEILRSVETLLANAEGIVQRELIAGRAFVEKHHPSVEVLKAIGLDKDEAGMREARWIARRIVELHTGGPHSFSDFAVLCRNSDSMPPLLAAFGEAGIPFVCGRRQSFLLSREGLDITALLHVIANPRDTVSLATVLRSDLVGVSDEALLRLRLLARSNLPALSAAAPARPGTTAAGSISSGLNMIVHDPARLADFNPDDAAKLSGFAENLNCWRAEQPVIPLEVLISRIVSKSAGGRPVTENVETILRLARIRGESRGLHAFLREIESLQRAINTESELADADQGDCVQVMTAHAAKGLEFPVTIIAAMEKGTQRDSAAVTFTPNVGLGIKWNHPHNDDGIPDSWQLANRAELRRREKEESNRLLYVAMTRAEDHLILSYSVTDRKKPSNWAKLVEDLYQPEALGSDPPLLHAPASDSEDRGIIIIPRPSLTGQHDSTANVTSLAVFARCPRQYFLERYIGWNWGRIGRSASTSDTPAAELGTEVHNLLAARPGAYSIEAHQLAAVFEKSELGLAVQASPRVFREWDFILDIDGTLVRGVIDLWFEKDGEIHIVDYKTDSQADPAPYIPQLQVYALALERAFGRRASHAWLHFLRFNRLIEISIDHTAVHELIARLKFAQNEQTFDLNEGDQCRSCSFYRGLCPAK